MSTKMYLFMIVVCTITLTSILAADNPPPQKNRYPHTASAKINNGAVQVTIDFAKVPKENRPPETSHFKADRPLTSVTVKYSGLEAGKDFTYFTDPECDHLVQFTRNRLQDLSGKHGVLKGNGPAETPLAVYYDAHLPLTYSQRGIVGKSVVIHDPTGAAVACGNVVDPTAPAVA
ncbi:uncharacterized protein PGTG_17718 [Puccinia graminis f. sp. tritici CRL 75-36-700-3]|uniref:Superoxide dismutase copper/zinc binding domain-containing protein n=1 Tax=Puccinia graminis f. sp. tritici (strain CRL 75-36-700-3 / race SCCL) TaxID=418459 RepID=E3L4J3_PUCGT|nr:uncharacterized protein PGTG_17718 [Puccinia graminis f. sp. tritici CRL 75-36-700-3]EFP91468.1 hypothetical protein PGTG_17718 [Puccinia graminis f. sp. tritici CRL 75-36-700-3]